MIKVDIILPIYNCEKYIEEAMNSIVGQSFENWKLIIIDDGSTDSTPQLIGKYLKDNLVGGYRKYDFNVGLYKEFKQGN